MVQPGSARHVDRVVLAWPTQLAMYKYNFCMNVAEPEHGCAMAAGEIPQSVGSLSRLCVLNIADNLMSSAPSPSSRRRGTSTSPATSSPGGSWSAYVGNLTMLSRTLLGQNIKLSGSVPTSGSPTLTSPRTSKPA
uniref:Uncharacterized protein n=1 Tax=Oryza brachyantha TaxID=4533 RepID=J3N8D5_ORYBR